jgi:hypothetical protein
MSSFTYILGHEAAVVVADAVPYHVVAHLGCLPLSLLGAVAGAHLTGGAARGMGGWEEMGVRRRPKKNDRLG